MSSVKAPLGIRMEHARSGNPSFSQSVYSGPVGRASLSPTTQCPSPEPSHPFTEYPEAVEVPRYCVVVEVTLYDRLEPLTGLRHWIVHSPTELLLNFLQLRPHALADRLAPYHERPVPVLPAHVRDGRANLIESWCASPMRAP
jgi:hypothetical protein